MKTSIFPRGFFSCGLGTLLIIISLISPQGVYAQNQKITLKLKDATIEQAIHELKKQTKLDFFFSRKEIDTSKKITVNAKDASFEEVLKLVFGNQYSYEITNGIVALFPDKKAINSTVANMTTVTVKGQVKDEAGAPLIGVTVLLKNRPGIGTATDINGEWSLTFIPENGVSFLFSMIGMDNIEVPFKGQTSFNVVMKENKKELEEVVITGIYSRKKESFTGSSQTYNGKALKAIGNQNVLQSLKSLDPSFAIIENNQAGSNPNRLPDIEVRGKTSVVGLDQEFGTDPNQPLFILDGFESTLATINDLSMDRVESITVLKDAAATAIYGSKAANGVVVVETKRPEIGTLRVNYNGNLSFTFADLSDYNLMNSSEKLQFERLAGYYGPLDANGEIIKESEAVKYNARLAEVARGVNTSWIDEPLRFAASHKHTLFVEGGDNSMRYGAGFNYGNTEGVMKGSNREIMNGNIRLIYRRKNIAFTNYLNLDYCLSNSENVKFSEFARANPYRRMYDEEGDLLKNLEKYTNMDSSSDNWGKDEYVSNPAYDRQLGSFDRTSTFGFKNNFEIDWRIIDELRVKGRFSVAKSNSRNEKFKSPNHSDFSGTEAMKKGTYNELNTNKLSYDGDFNATYGKEFRGEHILNAVAGVRINQDSYLESGYAAYGFIDDSYSNPAFSTGYPDDKKKPVYVESTSRAISYYLNAGYSYRNRYLLDANIRSDGSSVFGATKKFTTTWAVGVAWNLHKESFMERVKWLTQLKLRASIGNPGNQNFDAYISMKTYRYNNTLQNPFGLSTIIDKFGNHELEWQKTIDKNIGFDLEILAGRIKWSIDIFNKVTDPLLVYIAIPSSAGSTKMPQNMGKQLSKGVTTTINAIVLRGEDFSLAVNANARFLRSEYRNIGNSLDEFNKNNQSRNLTRYYDGASPTALWTVRSAGIDPGTGREIFIKKDGTQSFVYDYADEVKCGDYTPKVEGVFGVSFYYKGFSASANFRYRIGAQAFMSSLYDKVENISQTAIKYNQDKRALYDRWQNPGDIAKYKAISLSDKSPMSSRFIADENTLSGESVSFGYESQAKWLRRLGASSMSVRAYMNDIFRISSIKNERGIDYPFARSVSFSLGLRF